MATGNGKAALELRNVTVRFDGQTVLDHFSMALEAGEKALLTGPSGCGKSTVLRCLLGFVAPEAGSIHIEGKLLNAHTVWTLRRHLAYVGQEPELGTGTVNEILERPFHFHANAPLRANLHRVPQLCEQFGLAQSLLRKEPGDLSGGEKQRIALISALLLDRTVFLLDEVTSALDRASKRIVLDYFQSRNDVTTLFVAHDSEWFAFADQTIEMPGRHPTGGEGHD
ncbi:MAG: ATP-binding cassette domain-containing protein [Phycisphaerales bacterium]|nr:MAG: ATP-binding cassette domain-containing protein [Phycisphaerales bacterium]